MKTPEPGEFLPLIEGGYDLIPLHRWDETTELDGGKVRYDGKRPEGKRWTTNMNRGFCPFDHMRDGKNVGVRLRDTDLVVDVDPRNFRDGVDSFRKLCGDLGLDPSGWPCVETGGGGQHYYLSKPEGLRTAAKLEEYPGVEFLTRGKQVVAPGSLHPETERHYGWRANHEDLAWLGAPEAPLALRDALAEGPRGLARPSGGRHITNEEVAELLGKLDPCDFAERADWLRIGFACHHGSGGEALEEFVEWSAGDPKYTSAWEDVVKTWESCRDNVGDPVRVGTLFKAVRDAGGGDVVDRILRSSPEEDFGDEGNDMCGRNIAVNKSNTAVNTIKNALVTIHRSGVGLAFDELQQQAVFIAEKLPWGERHGRYLDDDTVRILRQFLIKTHEAHDYQPSKDNVFEAARTLALCKRFNPVLDYLDSLEWDGVPRVGWLFPDYFGTEDDDYARAVSTCFMVAAVRRQRHPGCKFDTMPVLTGRQGVGKSTGVRLLFGERWFSDTDLGDLRSKDAPIKIEGIWVKEFAELDALRRQGADVLKSFLSSSADRIRRPYDRASENLLRRCVFIATGNESGYLKDATGGRRFWPLRVGDEINLEGIERDRDQLWAEASCLEAEGTSIVLPKELWTAAAEHQEAETSEDPWADILRSHLDGPSPRDRVHTSELFLALDVPRAQRTSDKAQKIRTIMEHVLGWARPPGKGNVRIGERSAKGYIRPAKEDQDASSS